MRRAVLCPDPERLSQLMTGEISELAAAAVERHVAECRRCAETIGSLHADNDPILLALRNPPSRNDAAVIEELVLRLQAIPEATLRQAVDHTRDESDFEYTLPAQPAGDVLGLSNGIADGEPWMLGSFRLLRAIGAGGMGVVYEADDMMLGRRVAVKVIRPALAGDPATRQRFLREARASAMDHEHIVGVYQAGEAEGTLFLAMPLLQGETLETRLARESKLPLADVIRIGREIANGLSAAHRRGLIHRDLKPNNVWLESPGDRVKLLDFGLARSAEGHEQLTHSSLIAGTPLYMAPEQARGEAIDCRADLFSLGCVLYRALTGTLPFPGSTTLAVLHALANTTPRWPQAIEPTVPRALSQLVMRLLSRNPAERPSSADELVQVLEQVSQPRQKRRAAAGTSRSRGAKVLVGAVLLIGLVIASTLIGHRGDSSSPPIAAGMPSEFAAATAATPVNGSKEVTPIVADVTALELVFTESFDDSSNVSHGDSRQSWGVEDGIWFDQVTGGFNDGTYHSYGVPQYDFIAEIRFRTDNARLGLSFRPLAQGGEDCHVSLDAHPGGSWNLVRHFYNRKLKTHRIEDLHWETTTSHPLFAAGQWTTLRVEAVGEVIRLFSDGHLTAEVQDPYRAEPGFAPNRYAIEIGMWLFERSTGRMELDDIRIWRPDARLASFREQTLEPKQQPVRTSSGLSQSTVDPAARNREVAKWTLASGGKVWGLQVGGPPYLALTTPDAIPPSDFRVVSVELPYLESLTDSDLARLARLSELRFFSVSHTNIGDEGLVHLASLPKLESLNLLKTRVTSFGLVHLEDIRSLRSLNLGYNPAIDDAAVEHLAAMSHLTELNLAGTKLSPRGRDALKSALPNCAVRP